MSETLRAAIFLKNLAGGGAERSMVNLASGLVAAGYAVDMVLAKAEGPYLSQVPAGARIIDFGGRTLESLPKLVRYLRRETPDTLLSALDHVNIVALWARALSGTRIRTVISARNTLSAEAETGKSFKKRLEPLMAKMFYGAADGIVAVSGGVADDLSEMTGLPRERIQVIYNPVISAELLAQSREPTTHPWFAPGQPPVILAVGRLTGQKDFGVLLRAFARVRKSRSVRLLILGEGEERASLEALVSELGLTDDVSLPGFADNPFAFMAQARLFVLSSRFEGLPGVLIQALGCGCPVVSTDCPSGPFEVLAGGRWGRLVPVGDVEALASAMEASLAEERVTPPQESWAPYEIGTATAQYVRALFPQLGSMR